MRLSKRILASRANGAKSRGPKTEAGKLRSSINAMRHGLLSRCVVLQNEPQENFKALFQQHIDKLGPVDDVELACVEEMSAALWRLRRLMAIETNLLDQAVANRHDEAGMARIAGAFSQLAAGNELALIDRYESRLHRIYQRSLHNFLLLREFGNPTEPGEPDTGQSPEQPEPAAPVEPAAPPPTPPAPDLPNSPQPNEPRSAQPPAPSITYAAIDRTVFPPESDLPCPPC